MFDPTSCRENDQIDTMKYQCCIDLTDITGVEIIKLNNMSNQYTSSKIVQQCYECDYFLMIRVKQTDAKGLQKLINKEVEKKGKAETKAKVYFRVSISSSKFQFSHRDQNGALIGDKS